MEHEVEAELDPYIKSVYTPKDKGVMRINVPESVRSKYTTIPMHKAPSYQDVKQDWTDWMKGIVWPGHITNKALILRDQDGNHYEFIPGELGEFDNQLNKLYDLIG